MTLETDPTDTVEIQNVVGAGDLEREVDLATLASDLNGADYQPSNFSGLLYQAPEHEATVMVFESGKATVTGATSTSEMRTAFEHFVTIVRDLGVSVEGSPEITVQNIVATADLDEQLNLSPVAIGLGLEQTEYEPEQFPGLVYRLDSPTVVVLLFGSGKLVMAGATERTTLETVVATVAEQLADLSLLAD